MPSIWKMLQNGWIPLWLNLPFTYRKIIKAQITRAWGLNCDIQRAGGSIAINNLSGSSPGGRVGPVRGVGERARGSIRFVRLPSTRLRSKRGEKRIGYMRSRVISVRPPVLPDFRHVLLLHVAVNYGSSVCEVNDRRTWHAQFDFIRAGGAAWIPKMINSLTIRSKLNSYDAYFFQMIF